MKKKHKSKIHQNLRLQKVFWTANADKYSRKLRSEALSDRNQSPFLRSYFQTRYPLDVGHQGTVSVSDGAFTVNDKICRDRKERKRVLFALGKAGKIKVRKALWTAKSQVRCN